MSLLHDSPAAKNPAPHAPLEERLSNAVNEYSQLVERIEAFSILLLGNANEKLNPTTVHPPLASHYGGRVGQQYAATNDLYHLNERLGNIVVRLSDY